MKPARQRDLRVCAGYLDAIRGSIQQGRSRGSQHGSRGGWERSRASDVGGQWDGDVPD